MKKVLPIFCIFGLLIGCSSGPSPTKPNISVLHNMPVLKNHLSPLPAESKSLAQGLLTAELKALFLHLYNLNPALALAVGKLPEFQGSISKKQIIALGKFVNLIEKATKEEKDNLALLMQEGKPNVRRYCTPLQAIMWLLEKDEISLETSPLLLPFKDLLINSWGTRKNGNWADQNRWGDFNMVTDRLNSPRLLNYYERANFSYRLFGDAIPPLGPSPNIIFELKRGSCSYYTSFSVYCLRKAGYSAKAITVNLPINLYAPNNEHVVCEYEDKDGKKYVLDNACVSCGSMKGITEKKIYTKDFPQLTVGYH